MRYIKQLYGARGLHSNSRYTIFLPPSSKISLYTLGFIFLESQGYIIPIHSD